VISVTRKKNIMYKKIAMIFSLCAIILSVALGAGTSLAWFSDNSDGMTNIFHFANFDVDVSFLDEYGNWKSIDSRTDIFDQEALYEPGYVEVVYFRIDNAGDVEFDFKTTVSVVDSIPAENANGDLFYLHRYLKFGVVFADGLDQLKEKVKTREQAIGIANAELGDDTADKAELGAGKSCYMALVVHMPESVGNDANYVGNSGAEVKLGIIVDAMQKRS